jgi:hypothetical protein
MTPRPARHLIRAVLRATGFHGVSLPPFGIYILAERLGDDRLVRHEQAHWAQYARMGLLRYYATYAWQVLRYGYHNAPMEREARDHALRRT